MPRAGTRQAEVLTEQGLFATSQKATTPQSLADWGVVTSVSKEVRYSTAGITTSTRESLKLAGKGERCFKKLPSPWKGFLVG